MIVIEHLIKRFGRATAVNDVSLSVSAGESVALWGSNGAGKTTIIRCLLGLLSYHGSIRVSGVDVARQGKLARGLIGYVPQELGFYDDLRVGEAIRFFARLKAQRVDDVDSALGGVGLKGHVHKRIRELSGGMKQRLALAVAMLGDPPILVLDEVTASLDAGGRGELVELLAGLRNDGRRAMLFASHRIEEIEALATRVVVLEQGRIASDQITREFVGTPDPLAGASLLHLFLDPRRSAEAISLLTERGFSARQNGRGIFVNVATGLRAAPLRILEAARIRVDDFEIISNSSGAEQ
jgi:ABC-type multidrug transport system ATPase subunit